ATSYKEETILRKDHFQLDGHGSQARRGTMSFVSGRPTPATVSTKPGTARQDRRHVSVIQLNRLKREIIATAPRKATKSSPSPPPGRIRPSPPNSTPPSRISSPIGRSKTISSPSPSPVDNTTPTRRAPPPLKRTWAPPVSGPPKEPLPSPPQSNARGTPLNRSATVRSPSPQKARGAASPSPKPMRRDLPPIYVPLKMNTGSSVARGALGGSVPPSPASARSVQDTDDSRTPVREDPNPLGLGLTADAPGQSTTVDELREALRKEMDKYTRLSTYLLDLTEQHAREKEDLMRRVDGLEREVGKKDKELRGLRWIVANAGGSEGAGGVLPMPFAQAHPAAPARADSNTLP
ncbi:uncharacterized protein BXZ73DRAFT_111, partial [Epithele typhae]|uniref:uncharacterized protein n=1 Tax=Epithele typhae TaxID=378194 RepID=UPI0020080D9A